MSAVALMDARSIAATAANGGILTPATDLDCWGDVPEYNFDKTVYDRRVYNGTEHLMRRTAWYMVQISRTGRK